jgi:hypothetical protein
VIDFHAVRFFGDGANIFLSKEKKIFGKFSLQEFSLQGTTLGTLTVAPRTKSESAEDLCLQFCNDYIIGKPYFMGARLGTLTFATTPRILAKQFPQFVSRYVDGWGDEIEFPNGIIAHLTQQCDGNVHEHGAVLITSSAPHSDKGWDAASNVADFERDNSFW